MLTNKPTNKLHNQRKDGNTMANEQVSISKEELAILKAAKAKVDKKEDVQRRNWTKRNLLIKKAIAAGITASEAEIDAELKRIDGK